MSVELPKDAEGREIPLDTVALYDDDGNVHNIRRFMYTNDFDLNDKWINSWIAVVDDYKTAKPEQMHLTPPDSWEKLEEGLSRAVEANNICMYFSESGTCLDCAISNTPGDCSPKVLEHILDRIRTLRGED
jgi:hypothetical protein